MTICPTRVGMNRRFSRSETPIYHLPHTRGDEPDGRAKAAASEGICPTRVGMNRGDPAGAETEMDICPTRVGMNRASQRPYKSIPIHLPHTRGDEPKV